MQNQAVTGDLPTVRRPEAAPRTRVQITMREHHGRRVFDVRVWSRSGAIFFPTSRGIELPLELLPSLAKAASDLLQEEPADGANIVEPVVG